MSFRIQMVMEQQKMSRDEAVQFINDADRRRRDWTRSLYGRDWLDPSLYDLTILFPPQSIEPRWNQYCKKCNQ